MLLEEENIACFLLELKRNWKEAWPVAMATRMKCISEMPYKLNCEDVSWNWSGQNKDKELLQRMWIFPNASLAAICSGVNTIWTRITYLVLFILLLFRVMFSVLLFYFLFHKHGFLFCMTFLGNYLAFKNNTQTAINLEVVSIQVI